MTLTGYGQRTTIPRERFRRCKTCRGLIPASAVVKWPGEAREQWERRGHCARCQYRGIGFVNEFDAIVLEHIRKYPGLGTHNIMRALRTENKTKVEWALTRLCRQGLVDWEDVPHTGPSGFKKIWKVVDDERTRDDGTATESAQPAVRDSNQ
jgi:hypothetical protein